MSYPSRPYGYARRRVAWLVVVLFIIIVSVVTSISLSIHYSSDSNDLDTVKEYALTDKVIRSYNRYFCQDLEAVSTDIPDASLQSNATLYLLSSRPSLTDSEHFNFTEQAALDSIINYHVWNFYLNTGSQVSLNVCYPLDSLSGSYLAKFYLIKGTKNHNKWTNDPDQSYAVKYSRLLSKCQMITYQVQNDDLYYFVFYLDTTYLSLTTTIDVSFDFHRTVYHISPVDVVQNCSIPLNGYSSCSISVPMSSGYTVLLSLNTSLPVDYSDGANVEINCQHRVWFYAMIVVCAILPVIIIIVVIVTCCVCIKIRQGKKNRYSPLLSGNQRNTTVNTSTTSGNSGQVSGTTESTAFANSGAGSKPPAGNPPAYNPSYSPPAGGGAYGATSLPAPPPYAK